MKISRVQIDNYRNLRHVDVSLDNLVALAGENNAGKSNFLRALSLPLSSEEGGTSKRLSWFDVNNDAKKDYYDFIEQNAERFARNGVDVSELSQHIPVVSVSIDLDAGEAEHYDIRDLLTTDGGPDNVVGRIRYRWSIERPSRLLALISDLVTPDIDIQSIKMSLLPMELFHYEISAPDVSGDRRVPYDTLARFKYAMLPAERDSFSSGSTKIGSHALVGLLEEKLEPQGQKEIEQAYGAFMATIRKSANLDEIINWQDHTDVPNAGDFFDNISVLPNMPAMSSILSSIRLGYGDESLALQGLGQRNLILMAVLLNSYLMASSDISLRVVAVEEPEAHLCVNNVLLMASLFKTFGEKDCHTQLIYSTHDPEFVNKVGLDKVLVLHSGSAISLKDNLSQDEMDYLAANPNTDIFKLFFSRRLILVEGITEELLIKAYLQTKPELNNIKVMSFHKGYKNIIKIWKRINSGNDSRLGIVRDSDNQPKAQAEHEQMQNSQVCVQTTSYYTLETEFVNTGDNYRILRDRYGDAYGWSEMSKDELQKDWRSKKSDVMLAICHDLLLGSLEGLTMPEHIQKVLHFLTASEVSEQESSVSDNED